MIASRTIYTGASFIWPTTWRVKSTGTAINLTGKVFNFRLLNGQTTILDITSGQPATALGSELTITNAAAGQFQIAITDEETAAFPIREVTGILKYTESGVEKVMFKKSFWVVKG